LLFLEGRAVQELGAFMLLRPWLSAAPRGDGHPVLVLPGLLASDLSTQPLRSFLKAQGYAAHGWKQGRNLGLRPGIEASMLDRIDELYERHGHRKISLVGWSLGGIYARQLAKAFPALTRSVITLGSPFAGSARATRAWRLYEWVSGQRVETCDSHMGGRLAAPPPVPTTAVYSRTDGICAWQCCVERQGPLAESVEVRGSHLGLPHNPLVFHVLADRLAQPLGQPVVVENRTGGGGRIAAQQLKATPAQQNVLLLANPALMLVAPLVFKDAGYDPDKDFQPVSQASRYEFAVAVGAGVPVRELNHLLAWLRANPEQANFGVPATGSLPHFFGLMVGDAAKVRAEVVGYRGSAPLLNDLLGGQVPVAFDTFDTLLPQHEAGKIRILAVSGAKRSALDGKIPTFKESGLDLAATGWNTFFAPMGMPKAQAERLAALIHEVMKDPDTQRKFEAAKMEPVVATMAQTEAMLKAYRAQWAPVVQRSGFKP